MGDEKKRITKYIEELFDIKDPNKLKEWYNEWAVNYEKESFDIMGYTAHYITVDRFLELGVPKDNRILDIGAGTGIIGQLLQKNGYTNIDALDASPGMLKMAEKKKCYKNLINSFVAKDIVLPFDDQTYDTVILNGCLCPGHIKWDSFPQIIRLVKPGGIIFWVLGNDKEYQKDEDFRDGKNEKLVQSLVDQKLWQFLPGFPKRTENYIQGMDATHWAMKVI